MQPWAAAILLAGSPDGGDVAARCGVSVVDLPVSASGASLLDEWTHGIRQATEAQSGGVPIIVCSPRTSPRPRLGHALPEGITFRPDEGDVRGTGGATLDAISGLEDDAWVLVAEAGVLPVPPLVLLSRGLSDRRTLGVEALLGVHEQGDLAGVMLARVGAMRKARRAQFSDLKEQLVPEMISQGGDVRTCVLPGRSWRLRAREDYLGALADALGWSLAGGDGVRAQVFSRGISASIVSEGARVGVGATIRGSVVMRGATIEPDAVVYRSVLGPAAIVRASEKCIEREARGQ